MIELRTLIGIPYKECNCFEVVHKYFALAHNEFIPFSDQRFVLPWMIRNRRRDGARIEEGYASSTKKIITKIDDIKTNDIVLLCGAQHDFTVGVYVGKGKCLTSNKKSGTYLVTLSRYRRFFVKGFRVHEK